MPTERLELPCGRPPRPTPRRSPTVHLRVARGAAAMPPRVHTDDEVARLARRLGSRADEVWVAEVDGALVGYARFTDDLARRPVRRCPAHAGQGVGSALLDLVKAQRPDGFCLWVFEMNAPARAFYARHGLVELERTDGSANEERSPDVRMAWPGADPLAFCRGLIDEVDEQLGDLLARRAALTRAVQDTSTTRRATRSASARSPTRWRPRRPRSGASGWPGSCTRSSPRASTRRAERRCRRRVPTIGSSGRVV